MSVTNLGAPERTGRAGPGRGAREWLAARSAVRGEAVDLGLWVGVTGFGLVVTALIATTDVDLGTGIGSLGGGGRPGVPAALAAEPPFGVGWRAPRVGPALLLAPAVAIITLAIARWSTRIRWRHLLVLGFVGSLSWSLALAAAAGPGLADGLRPAPAYTAAAATAGDDPLGYLAGWAARAADGTLAGSADALEGGSALLASHPPGPVLLVWALDRVGLGGQQYAAGGVLLGIVLTALTALSVPLVTVAVRSLCHETAARRTVPVLILSPWALWAVASPQAVTMLPAAAAVATGVVGCEPGRRGRPLWALASGLLLGITGLFDYAAVWLGIAVAAAYFVRRRPQMNVFTGLGALLPLWVFFAWGFSWPDGLARARLYGGLASDVAWLALDAVVILLLGGPVLVRALRRIRLTPGWPFLIGAGAAALFSLCAGLAWGGVERAWLPLAPWLAVAALAPRPRPVAPGDTVRAGDLPLLLIGTGAVTAVVLRVFLDTG